MSEQANIAGPDPSAIAGAIEVLRADASIPFGAYADEPPETLCLAHIAAIRTLLADHARLEAENARLREGVEKIAILADEAVNNNGGIVTIRRCEDIADEARALTNREGQDNG